jgi:hypothetical protein
MPGSTRPYSAIAAPPTHHSPPPLTASGCGRGRTVQRAVAAAPAAAQMELAVTKRTWSGRWPQRPRIPTPMANLFQVIVKKNRNDTVKHFIYIEISSTVYFLFCTVLYV